MPVAPSSAPENSASGRTLAAVLLSPPITSGNRTRAAVGRAASVLGFDTVMVGNLLSLPTASSGDVRHVGREPRTWLASREPLATTITAADELLIAWGRLHGLGPVRVHAQAQIAWLATVAKSAGFDEVWSVGPDHRHPSRWHQYTADKHGRTSGGTPEQRLREVLVSLPWDDVTAQG